MRDEVLGRRQVSALLACAACACAAPACSPPPKEVVVAVPGNSPSPIVVETTPTVEPTSEPAPKAPGAIAWETSKEAARARSRARDRPLLVFVFAAWSAACVHMDRTTWTDPRVVELARSFVALRLDVTDVDSQAQAEADAFGVSGLPTVLLFDAHGNELTRFESLTSTEVLLAAMSVAAAD